MGYPVTVTMWERWDDERGEYVHNHMKTHSRRSAIMLTKDYPTPVKPTSDAQQRWMLGQWRKTHGTLRPPDARFHAFTKPIECDPPTTRQ